jgi:hypothetical protein
VCVAANRGAEEASPEPRVPEKEIRSIRSNPRDELAPPQDEIEPPGLNSHPFNVALNGIDCVLCPTGNVIFFVFYFALFCGHAF